MNDERGTMTVKSQGRSFHRSSIIVHRSALILPLLTALAVIIFWHYAVILTHTKIFPTPLAVAQAIAKLSSASILLRYIRDSLLRVCSRYLAAVLLVIPLR